MEKEINKDILYVEIDGKRVSIPREPKKIKIA